MPSHTYRGRFAPSPTGELHLGSLACAMASFLDARSHDGAWILRIEDIDTERCKALYSASILKTLERFGLVSDERVVYQRERTDLYEAAFQKLKEENRIYGCACTRKEIEARCKALNLPAGVYPGTCRERSPNRPIRSWRFKVSDGSVSFHDRLAGLVTEDTAKTVGDFVIKRADGLWAYQLAVVVDDASQGITDIVRGADLLDNTARQIHLQRALGFNTPRYMHIPLVLNEKQQKLSKQTKAASVANLEPLTTLDSLLPHFGLPRTNATTLQNFWRKATALWKEKYLS